MKNQSNSVSMSRAIIIEVLMFLTYAFFAVNWIAGSTLTPEIMKHFHLNTFASATFISNAITVAKIIGNFMAAHILMKLFPKKAIGLGAGLIVLGCVVAIFAPTYVMFIIGRFIMGFGGALYIVYFSPITIQYFEAKQRPAVNALNSVGYTFGGIIAMLMVGPVSKWLQNWQYSMGFFAIISMLLFSLWPIIGLDFELSQDGGATQENYTIRQALQDRTNWMLPFTYSGSLTFYLVILNILPIYNVTVVNSKILSTLVAVGGLLGAFIAIAIGKVYFKRIPVIRISGLCMVIFGVVMFQTKHAVIAVIAALLIGIFLFLPMGSLQMIPQELPGMTPAKLTTIMGLFWAIAYVIESVAYFVIGNIIDHFGCECGFTVALVMCITFYIGSFFLPETGKKI